MGCECLTFEGFLQQAVRLCGLGYYYYRLTEYPDKKRDRWADIDAKLQSKYAPLGLSKYARARRKARGLLNGQFLRFDRFALLMLTEGKDDCGILKAERPQDARTVPIRLPLAKNIGVIQIGRYDGRWTVRLERSSFCDLEAYYREAARKSALEELKREFEALDRALPSWHGLYVQKTRLRDTILLSARQAGRKWEKSAFPVARLKRSVKVFC